MEEVKFPEPEFIQGLVDPAKPIEEVKLALTGPKGAALLDGPIDEQENYLIFRAAKAGNLPLVSFILDLKPKQLSLRKESSLADVLQFAVGSGNLDLVKFLVSRGADVHQRYFMEVSILYFAAKSRHYNIFKYFVDEFKMDANDILASNGIQALYMALEFEDKEFFRYLLSFNPHIENIGPYNYVAYAARLPDTYYLEELLKRNAPFEVMEPYNRSGFSWAGEDGKHEQMELILKMAKNVKAEPLLASGISSLSLEYNALAYKWQRLYDIYMTRYYCELKRKETEPKETTKTLMANQNLEKVYTIISTKDTCESLIFKVPRNIFKFAMKYLDNCQPNLAGPEP